MTDTLANDVFRSGPAQRAVPVDLAVSVDAFVAKAGEWRAAHAVNGAGGTGAPEGGGGRAAGAG